VAAADPAGRGAGHRAGWSAADVPLLDEAAALAGDGDGVTYGHVVVDETQELSGMAWRMRAPGTAIEGLVRTAGRRAVIAPHEHLGAWPPRFPLPHRRRRPTRWRC
jgi:hypothetical protein